jgi:hypothetical protein
MAQLLKVTPHQNNDEIRVGQCGHWDREPSRGQAAQFESNEWPTNGCRTYRPPNYGVGAEVNGQTRGEGALWGLLLILTLIGVCIGSWAGWQYIILPIVSRVLK